MQKTTELQKVEELYHEKLLKKENLLTTLKNLSPNQDFTSKEINFVELKQRYSEISEEITNLVKEINFLKSEYENYEKSHNLENFKNEEIKQNHEKIKNLKENLNKLQQDIILLDNYFAIDIMDKSFESFISKNLDFLHKFEFSNDNSDKINKNLALIKGIDDSLTEKMMEYDKIQNFINNKLQLFASNNEELKSYKNKNKNFDEFHQKLQEIEQIELDVTNELNSLEKTIDFLVNQQKNINKTRNSLQIHDELNKLKSCNCNYREIRLRYETNSNILVEIKKKMTKMSINHDNFDEEYRNLEVLNKSLSNENEKNTKIHSEIRGLEIFSQHNKKYLLDNESKQKGDSVVITEEDNRMSDQITQQIKEIKDILLIKEKFQKFNEFFSKILKKTEYSQECGFCDQKLSKDMINKIKERVQKVFKSLPNEDIQSIKKKLEGLKEKKALFKQKKQEYEKIRLIKEIYEDISSISEKIPRNIAELLKEKDILNREIEKINGKIENQKNKIDIIEKYRKYIEENKKINLEFKNFISNNSLLKEFSLTIAESLALESNPLNINDISTKIKEMGLQKSLLKKKLEQLDNEKKQLLRDIEHFESENEMKKVLEIEKTMIEKEIEENKAKKTDLQALIEASNIKKYGFEEENVNFYYKIHIKFVF